MNDNKTLFTSKNEPIPWFNKTVDTFIDKTALIFGGSGSGKTTIIEEILFLLKKKIPNYLIIAPKTSDKAYSNKLKRRCIKEDLTKQKIEKIWNRQYYVTQIYNTANDINVLKSLFNKTNDRKTYIMIQAIIKRALTKKNEITNNTNLNFAQKKTQTKSIDELCNNKIKALYKSGIRNSRPYLNARLAELNKKEKIAFEFLDLNPRLLMIIDDSTEKFQKWMKYFKKGEINPFESIFYKGRWNYITLIFAAHDDKVIVPELRKNARVTLYTTSQALMASLNKSQSGFTLQEKKFAQRCAEMLFNDDDTKIKSHKKLCYIREDNHPWKYTIADIYPDFTLGCEPLKNLINKFPTLDDGLSNNPFLSGIVPHNKKSKKYIYKSNTKKPY